MSQSPTPLSPSGPYAAAAGAPVKEAKPFYKRWWFITVVVMLVLGAFGSCGDNKESASSDASSAPAEATSAPAATTAPAAVALPDLTGVKGDVARQMLKDAGLTSSPTFKDADGKESVWDAANWSVVSQEPAADTKVEPGAVVTLSVNHDSADEAAAAATAAGEVNSQGLQQYTAVYTCGEAWENALQKQYPALKVKAHNIAGVITDELGSDDRFFVKMTIGVGEADYTIECYVGGTEAAPAIEPGQIY